MVEIDIDCSEVLKMLESMNDKAVDRCIRKALRAGAEIEQDAIIERAPEKDETGGSLPDGALKADIGIHFGKDEDGEITAIVGPGKYTRHVANWVEYGHRIVHDGYSRVIKTGKNAGKTRGPGIDTGKMVPEHPFIRPAYEATAEEVITTITKTLAEEITKAAQNKRNLKE